jgi:hypothetical protein
LEAFFSADATPSGHNGHGISISDSLGVFLDRFQQLSPEILLPG